MRLLAEQFSYARFEFLVTDSNDGIYLQDASSIERLVQSKPTDNFFVHDDCEDVSLPLLKTNVSELFSSVREDVRDKVFRNSHMLIGK